MTPQLTLLLKEALPAILIAAISGSAGYLEWRFSKNRWLIGINVLVALLGSYVLFSFYLLFNLVFLVICCLACAFGTYFHQKTTGYSITKAHAFLLLLASSFSGLFISRIIGGVMGTIDGTLRFSTLALYLHFAGLGIFPSMTPALIYMWQSMDLRPGMDKHVDP